MGLDLVVKVVRKRVEAEGIVLLDLEGDGAALPAFTAGAHIDVKTPSGAVRQYSLCGPPGQPGVQPGAGDAWVLRAGVAAVLGVLVTGFFEYNLGDSEILGMTLAAVAAVSSPHADV